MQLHYVKLIDTFFQYDKKIAEKEIQFAYLRTLSIKVTK